VQEDKIDIRFAETMAGMNSGFRRIDEPKVDNFEGWPREAGSDLSVEAEQAVLQSSELRPVRIETNAEQTYSQLEVSIVLGHACDR
jgi:hypothetical protein